jgi:polysaccharide deacetylase family protein (PEP-CTERM system associated)
MKHVFTVDVEEWFQVSAFERLVERGDWAAQPSRVDACVDRLLALLAEAGSSGTFFVLGWLADRRPGLVRRIADAGHEIASHGWWHRRVTTQQPAEFRADVRRARVLLEDIAGVPVTGYRAPSFSIVPGLEWAFDVLLDEGYRYDSSVFPIRRSSGYGYPDAPSQPYRLRRAAGELLELPITPLVVAGARVPASGGAYFRHLPYVVTRAMLRQRAARGTPGVFYLHPWEIDEGQPRLDAGVLTRIRHYGGIHHTESRLRRLLAEFRFVTAAEALGIQAPVPVHAVTDRRPT